MNIENTQLGQPQATGISAFDQAWNKLRSAQNSFDLGASKAPPEPRAQTPLPLFEITPELIDAATLEERDAIITDLARWGLLRLPFDRIAIKFPEYKIWDVLGWKPSAAIGRRCVTVVVGDGPLKVEEMRLCNSDPSIPLTYDSDELPARLAAGITLIRQVVVPPYLGDEVIVEKRNSVQRTNLPEIERRWDAKSTVQTIAAEALTILLASLAARNVVKEVAYNAREQYAGAAGVKYSSRIIIRPPRIQDVKEIDLDHSPRPGLAKLMLVRGFIRNQVADTTKPQPADVRVTVVGAGRTGRREQWIAPYYRGVDPDYVPVRHYVVRP